MIEFAVGVAVGFAVRHFWSKIAGFFVKEEKAVVDKIKSKL